MTESRALLINRQLRLSFYIGGRRAMATYLDQFLLTMSETQKQKLLELLEARKRQGLIKSDYELQIELDRLIKELDKRNGSPTFQARHQSGRISSHPYNDNLEEIHFDLQTLFQASNSINRLLTNNQQLSRSLLSEIRKKINTLESKISRYYLIFQNKSSSVDGIYEQFQTPEYTETDENVLALLRKDRRGQSVDPVYTAENSAGSLHLSTSNAFDRLRTADGASIASIRVRNRVGPVATNNQHTVNFAIDGSNDTFWAETVLVDEPIIQDIENLWSHDYHDYPKEGAICELEIDLNGLTTVSEIQFDPYCAYPLEIVSIHGYESEDSDANMYELISPNHENPKQRSQKSVSLMSFQFPSVDVSKIRILLRQENYVKEQFFVNKDEQNNMELWEKMASAEQLVRDYKEPGETVASLDKKNEIAGWDRYLTALKQWAKQTKGTSNVWKSAETALDIIRTGDYKNAMLLSLKSMTPEGEKNKVFNESILSQEWQATNKLAYVYGAYDIRITGRKYHRQSIYVSKILPLQGNVQSISLTTEEQHHDIEIDQDDKARITDIEYYVSYQKNADTWHPVLPTNKQYVEGELLIPGLGNSDDPLLEGTVVCQLRFPAVSKETFSVRRNGVPLAPSAFRVSDDMQYVGIVEEYFSPSSIYTVSYKPDDSAYAVEIDSDTIKPIQYLNDYGETGERFDRPNSNYTVTLSKTPFVSYSHLFSYDENNQRYVQDDSQLQAEDLFYPVMVRVNGEEYLNITDYTYNTFDQEKLKNSNDGKAFAHIGRTIYFAPPQQGRELRDIYVDYYYLSTDIRLKAILRRNDTEHDSITPNLYSYSIKCQSFDQEDHYDV